MTNAGMNGGNAQTSLSVVLVVKGISNLNLREIDSLIAAIQMKDEGGE